MNGVLRIAFILGELMAFSSGINSDDDFELIGKYGFSILNHSSIELYAQSQILRIASCAKEGDLMNDIFILLK